MSKNSQKMHEMTQTAILAALTAIVAFLPIRTLGLEITLAMVPVAIASAVLGKKGGTIVGTVFGIVSFIQCFGYSPFGAALLAINPLLTFLVCVPTRALAGFLPAIFASLLSSKGKEKQAMAAAAISAPILNTLFFMSALVLCFYNTEYVQGFVSALGASNPLTFVLLFVGINGLAEIIAGIAVAFPASIGISSALKRMK